MQDKNRANVKFILNSLADHLNVRGVRGLAEYLGESENKLYAWIKRGVIADTGSILGKCPEVNKYWLDHGIGPMTDNGLEKSKYTTPTNNQRPDGAFDIPPSTSQVPIISWAQAGQDGYFEDAYPPGAGFGYINRPYDVSDANAYALIISGDSMAPKFEAGDVVIISPAATVMTGDYAVVRLRSGEVAAKRVKEKNSHYVLESINPDYPLRECQKEDVVFMHRIVWVKQRG